MTEVFIAIIGLVAGVLAGMFGVGGGILFVPTLVLGLGLTQVHAGATSLLAIVPTAFVGTWRLQRQGLVDLKAAAVIGVVSIIGVQGGVLLAEHLPGALIRRLFGVLLLITAAQLALRARRSAAAEPLEVRSPDAVAEWLAVRSRLILLPVLSIAAAVAGFGLSGAGAVSPASSPTSAASAWAVRISVPGQVPVGTPIVSDSGSSSSGVFTYPADGSVVSAQTTTASVTTSVKRFAAATAAERRHRAVALRRRHHR